MYLAITLTMGGSAILLIPEIRYELISMRGILQSKLNIHVRSGLQADPFQLVYHSINKSAEIPPLPSFHMEDYIRNMSDPD